jgi:peroxiredoxin
MKIVTNKRVVWSALVVGLAGIAVFSVFGMAIADGESQRKNAPFEAFLGKPTYKALQSGEAVAHDYLGDTLGAPDFTLNDQYGKPWRLSAHRGKTIVMNFWTITCQPCVEEMPSLIDLARVAKQRPDLEIVAVTIDKTWQEVSALFPSDSPLRILFDPDRKMITGLFGTRLFPETWVIDADGIIRLRIDGARDWSQPLALNIIESFR